MMGVMEQMLKPSAVGVDELNPEPGQDHTGAA